MVKGSIQDEDITAVNIYVLKSISIYKANNWEHKGEIDSNSIVENALRLHLNQWEIIWTESQ